MVKAIKQGEYQLLGLDEQNKVLHLSHKKKYIWERKGGVGEIRLGKLDDTKRSKMLASGKYRIYEVLDDAKLANGYHLELSTGKGKWQGYLLTKGLPGEENMSSIIIPTIQLITKSVSI